MKCYVYIIHDINEHLYYIYKKKSPSLFVMQFKINKKYGGILFKIAFNLNFKHIELVSSNKLWQNVIRIKYENLINPWYENSK